MCEEAILRKTSLLKHNHAHFIHLISKGLGYKRFWVMTNKDPIKIFLSVLILASFGDLPVYLTQKQNDRAKELLILHDLLFV